MSVRNKLFSKNMRTKINSSNIKSSLKGLRPKSMIFHTTLFRSTFCAEFKPLLSRNETGKVAMYGQFHTLFFSHFSYFIYLVLLLFFLLDRVPFKPKRDRTRVFRSWRRAQPLSRDTDSRVLDIDIKKANGGTSLRKSLY